MNIKNKYWWILGLIIFAIAVYYIFQIDVKETVFTSAPISPSSTGIILK